MLELGLAVGLQGSYYLFQSYKRFFLSRKMYICVATPIRAAVLNSRPNSEFHLFHQKTTSMDTLVSFNVTFRKVTSPLTQYNRHQYFPRIKQPPSFYSFICLSHHFLVLIDTDLDLCDLISACGPVPKHSCANNLWWMRSSRVVDEI